MIYLKINNIFKIYKLLLKNGQNCLCYFSSMVLQLSLRIVLNLWRRLNASFLSHVQNIVKFQLSPYEIKLYILSVSVYTINWVQVWITKFCLN